ncbi:MAG TPA: phosphoglucosamine mutase [Acidimicrobiia bacterium]|nr:phosphoglucosamine mutase [Acidimicrobiia bacterium]
MDLRRRLDDGKPIFGTDGVRGVAGSELTAEVAMEIGRAAGSHLRGGPVVVGQDTRRSGSMLSGALQAGFHSAGIDTVDVGVLPSGGISFLTANSSATMGAIVSASHNPAADNGIKLIAARGTKLADSVEREIEERMRSTGRQFATGSVIGFRRQDPEGYHRYLDHLASASRYSLNGLRLALDCANGSAYKAAPELFERLHADVRVFHAEPNGLNINDGCGATNPGFLAKHGGGRIGLAFDGDADRLIAVDEDGLVANGDVIMAIIARHLKEQGRLTKDLVVATVMSNLGFRKSMAEVGIQLVETPVGDRYVMEALVQHEGLLGGEQSGHIIFTDLASTGDGLLTGVQLLNVVAGTGKELRQLRKEAMTEYPQVLVNVEIDRSVDVAGMKALWDEVILVEDSLGTEGRVLVRPSGTEPLVRIMVEAPSQERAGEYADRLAKVVEMAAKGE